VPGVDGARVRWTVVGDDYVNDVRFSPNGELLAVATAAGSIDLRQAATGELVRRHPAHAGGAQVLAWSPDGTQLASGGLDGRVRLYDANGAGPAVEVGAGWISALAWSADGTLVGVAAGKRVAWLQRDGRRVGEFDGHESTVTAIGWLPGSEQLLSICYGAVRFLRPGRGEPPRTLRWKGSLLALAISPDGSFIVTGAQDQSVHIWRTRTGEDLEMSGFPSKVKSLAFRGDGKRLVTAAAQFLVVWDFSGAGPGGKKGDVLEGHLGPVADVAYLRRWAKTREVVSVGRDRRLCFWAPERANAPVQVVQLPCEPTRIAVARDDVALAVGGAVGEVLLFSP
jgi:WD40 repeat protein